jgi:RHS repeat-associated protein
VYVAARGQRAAQIPVPIPSTIESTVSDESAAAYQTSIIDEHRVKSLDLADRPVEAGLNYVGARYYSPALGRFMQTDSVGGGMNLYSV